MLSEILTIADVILLFTNACVLIWAVWYLRRK